MFLLVWLKMKDEYSAKEIRKELIEAVRGRPHYTISAPFLNDDVPNFLRRLHDFERKSGEVNHLINTLAA